jgi:trk system potassium uptake protein TrkH
MAVVVILAIASLIIDIGGFDLSISTKEKLDTLNRVIITIFIAECFIKWGLAQFSLSYLKHNWPNFALIFVFLTLLIIVRYTPATLQVGGILRFINVSVARAYIVIVHLYIAGNLLIRGITTAPRIAKVNLPAAQILALSFLFVIIVGTGFLLLPRATASVEGISFINALFTASSATCVTGLIVVDTGTYFSRFGQIVIMILIQIGGLGLMTTTAFFSLILGRSMSVKESVLMSEVLSSRTLARISHLIISILILTLIFEALGVMAFYFSWTGVDRFEHGSVFYYSLFHSISAFCNAGFSLFRNSFENYKGNLSHNLTLTSLIIIGGLGFTVIMNLFRFAIFKRERLSLQTKLVLTMTITLLVLGTLLIMLSEWNNSLKEFPFLTKIMASYFQSVTTRTAGFNTINTSSLTSACYFLMMILMFIGASPGSTGGGIKTSTLGVILGSIWSVLKGRESVEIFKRRIPKDVVDNALVVIIMALILTATSGFILLLTQEGKPVHILFELFSAYGTVGLSAGITPDLTLLGKAIIIITMFVGRIGPLTLVLAIGQRKKTADYEYPDEGIMIG